MIDPNILREHLGAGKENALMLLWRIYGLQLLLNSVVVAFAKLVFGILIVSMKRA